MQLLLNCTLSFSEFVSLTYHCYYFSALVYCGFMPKEDTGCMGNFIELFYVDKERDCSTNCYKKVWCGAFTLSKVDINGEQFIRCILYDTCKERN